MTNKQDAQPLCKLGLQFGFTFIEILIVLTLIVAMGTVVLQSLGYNPTHNQNYVARDLMRRIRLAHSSAVFSNQWVRLRIDFEAQTYVLEASAEPMLVTTDSDAAKQNQNLFAETADTDAPLPPDFKGNFATLDEDFLEPFLLPPSVKIIAFFSPVHQKLIDEGQVALHFFPSGECEGGFIKIGQSENELFLVIHPLTAEVSIVTQEVNESNWAGYL